MTDLDLAGFRTAAIAEKEWTPDSVHQHAMSAHDTIQRQTQRILALLDRIESLEAERDGANHRGLALARAHDKEKARADRAEARLARVEALHTPVSEAQMHGEKVRHPNPLKRLCRQCCDLDGIAVTYPCATIRAVAADERESDNG